MFVVVCYDCANNKRRLKVADILLDYGYRVQYSVFEAELSEIVEREMLLRLKKAIDCEEDSLRVYHICQRCLAGIICSGNAELTNQEKVFIV